MINYRRRLFFLAMLPALLTPPLHAAPVTWYLNGVTFSDGSRAVGSFVYDTVTGLYTSINIVTTPGTGSSSASARVTDLHYTVQSAIGRPSVVVMWTNNSPIPGVTGILQWGFTVGLTVGGGNVPLDLGSYQGLCLNTTCQYAAADSIISVTGGSVTADPKYGPRTWYLDGVTFSDGGHATGSFVYDSVTNSYSQVDISVTAGTAFTSGYHYAIAGTTPAPTAFANTVRAFSSLPVPKGARFFNGNLVSALTNDGGIVAFNANAQESSCDSADCVVNGVAQARSITLGSVTTVRPPGYTKVLSQIVDGDGWQSTLTIANLNKFAQAYTVSYWQDDGTPWSIPGIGSSITLTVPGNGVKFLSSAGTGSALSQGWAKVEGAEAYSVMAIYKVHGNPQDLQGAVIGDPTGNASFSMPFDESNGAVVGLALTNPSPGQTQTTLLLAYDESGNLILNDTSIVLQPLEHTAFVLHQKFPGLANQRGRIRVFGLPTGDNVPLPFLGLNGMGVRNIPAGSFTNLQVTYE